MGCYFSGTVSQGWPGVSFRWHRVSELNVNVSSVAPCHRADLNCQFMDTVSEILNLHTSSVAPCLNSWTCISVQWHRISTPELAYQFSGTVSQLLNLHTSSVAPCLNSWTCIPVQWHRVSTPELAYQFSGIVSQLLNLYISSATSRPGTMKIIACYWLDYEGEEESFLWPDFSAWFLQVMLRE